MDKNIRVKFEPVQSLFGKNKLKQVIAYDDGISLLRDDGEAEYPFEKIGAYNYYAINKATKISIKIRGEKKPIEFEVPLSKSKEAEEYFLWAHRDYLLGPDFPQNLATLSLPLGFLGSDGGIQNGAFRLGKNTYPFADLDDFQLDTKGATGGVYVKLKSIKIKLMIKPEEAANILASVAILKAIKNENSAKKI